MNVNKLLHTPCWQEVGPDVYRLVVHLEAAEDAVQRWAPRVTVSRDDAVLPEHLRTNKTFQVSNYAVQKSAVSWRDKFPPAPIWREVRGQHPRSLQRAMRADCTFGTYELSLLLEFMSKANFLCSGSRLLLACDLPAAASHRLSDFCKVPPFIVSFE